MELIVDLHLHSHFSRATSKNATLEELYRWGKIKGLTVLGTGDFTHPGWFAEIREKLTEAEPGLFKLKADLAKKIEETLPSAIKNSDIRFILTSEISTIYSKASRVRKVHQLLVAPNWETVSNINDQLSRIGNLKADGRPILGLDSKKLLSIVLNTNPNILFIPAHIWTPWFSLFGSRSGFDSLEQAFDELAPEIKMIETGLSSDPFMSWRVKDLEKLTIISNSDAHSPAHLGREGTLMKAKLNYLDIAEGLKTNDQRVLGTIEFFPEEGKYHQDGHRNCGITFSPEETEAHQGICPICHKPITVGAGNRAAKLAAFPPGHKPAKHKAVDYIVPLLEIIAEIRGMTTGAKAVQKIYDRVIATFGSEFVILRKTPTEVLKQNNFPDVAYGIELMRKGEIQVKSGYDGVYGKAKMGNDKEKKEILGQMNLL